MSQRFEGRNLEDALQHASQTLGVERWQLTYHVLLEKRGFLGGVKRIVIEADVNREAPPPPASAAPSAERSGRPGRRAASAGRAGDGVASAGASGGSGREGRGRRGQSRGHGRTRAALGRFRDVPRRHSGAGTGVRWRARRPRVVARSSSPWLGSRPWSAARRTTRGSSFGSMAATAEG